MKEVFYATRKELHICLMNPGQVAANFQFMPLPGTMFGNPGDKEFRSTPRWATVHPEQVNHIHCIVVAEQATAEGSVDLRFGCTDA